MQIKKIIGDFAEVETNGLKRKVNIQMLPQAKIDDYVLVHAGFAIERVNPEKAKETLRIVNEIH